MAQPQQTAITPTRADDYPEWYQQVVKAADLAETSPVRGCMVIRPWGYGIWERMQRELDDRIKATGHENAYFPLFIPLSFLEKEVPSIVAHIYLHKIGRILCCSFRTSLLINSKRATQHKL